MSSPVDEVPDDEEVCGDVFVCEDSEFAVEPCPLVEGVELLFVGDVCACLVCLWVGLDEFVLVLCDGGAVAPDHAGGCELAECAVAQLFRGMVRLFSFGLDVERFDDESVAEGVEPCGEVVIERRIGVVWEVRGVWDFDTDDGRVVCADGEFDVAAFCDVRGVVECLCADVAEFLGEAFVHFLW